MRSLLGCIVILCGFVNANAFEYREPGSTFPKSSGEGRKDRRIYAPHIVFPIRLPARRDAYLNSQVWGVGGFRGPPGRESDPRNFRFPWADNYCEKRGWKMPLCPSGAGHQGVDIRGPTSDDNRWEVVAVEAGQVIHVSNFTSILLKGNSGTRYRYLHVHPRSIRVRVGQTVRAGQVIARISNYLGRRPQTTTHLHIDMEQTVSFNGTIRRVFVPPYSSLVEAYRKLKALPSANKNSVLTPDPKLEKSDKAVVAKPAVAKRPAVRKKVISRRPTPRERREWFTLRRLFRR
jgi:murein DD-endopeptidase MepM/ murein hydrolase activator NlpD